NDIVVGLPKLKFIKDHLCSSCELGKAKRKSFHTKLTPSSKRWLHLLHMDLCGPMRVASINGKRYMLVIVDDYSRYTWTHFLRSKDETPEVLIDFLRLVQKGLQAQVRAVRTNKASINGKSYVLVIVDDYSRDTWTYFLRSKDETPEVLIDLLRLVQRGLQAQVRVVVSKSSAVSVADAPNQRQQHTTPLNNHTTPAPTCQTLTLKPTVTSSENIKQAETYAENDQVADDEFI
nr:Gag-Pol polyprotein [Tanacetum cinerariifolium]